MFDRDKNKEIDGLEVKKALFYDERYKREIQARMRDDIGEGNPFCDLLMNNFTMVNYLATLVYCVNRDLEAGAIPEECDYSDGVREE